MPTILDNCHPDMNVVKDESFGPVLTVETFSSEQEALRLANDTNYGLAGAVWTTDDAKADRVASGLHAGTDGSTTITPTCHKRSGAVTSSPVSDAELGHHGLAEYRETKHIWRQSVAGSNTLVRRWVLDPSSRRDT